MPKDKLQTHIKIKEAAKREFMEYGFENASLRRIATEAGIQVGGIYKHFASKEELFDSLVEPAIKSFYELYHEMEREYFEEEKIDGTGSVLEEKGEVIRMMELIYKHFDEYKMLVLKSNGSKYEDFLHKVALLEEEVTLRYLDVLKEKGYKVNDFDQKDFHLLTTAYVESFFQVITHNLSKKKAMHYAETLEKFYKPAWSEFLGI